MAMGPAQVRPIASITPAWLISRHKAASAARLKDYQVNETGDLLPVFLSICLCGLRNVFEMNAHTLHAPGV